MPFTVTPRKTVDIAKQGKMNGDDFLALTLDDNTTVYVRSHGLYELVLDSEFVPDAFRTLVTDRADLTIRYWDSWTRRRNETASLKHGRHPSQSFKSWFVQQILGSNIVYRPYSDEPNIGSVFRIAYSWNMRRGAIKPLTYLAHIYLAGLYDTYWGPSRIVKIEPIKRAAIREKIASS